MIGLIDFAKARDAMLDMADTAAVDGDYEEAIRSLVAAFKSHIALEDVAGGTAGPGDAGGLISDAPDEGGA